MTAAPEQGPGGNVRRLAAILVTMAAANLGWSAPVAGPAVRLVVFISVDQCRSDYLTRFTDHYLPPHLSGKPGGFRLLVAEGAHYRDAHHTHMPTTTGPGHTTLATGAPPALHGIVGNRLFDRATGKTRRCVEDPTVQIVGGKATPASPRSILVTTIGDELKLASGGLAKVVAVAIKDRAAVPLAGHAADLALWLDDATGNWVTSTFYRPDGTLPGWVASLNHEHRLDRYVGQAWKPLLPRDAYRQTLTFGRAAGQGDPLFSHHLPATTTEDYYDSYAAWGPANDEVIEVAKRAIAGEQMGKDDIPDLFLLNLSTNDYVGHTYGPNSAEIMDVSVRTDRALAELFRFLDAQVPGGLGRVLVVVTGDHGVSTAPEEALAAARIPVGRGTDAVIAQAMEEALDTAYGPADWVVEGVRTSPNIYLNLVAASERHVTQEDMQRTAALAAGQATGVFVAFSRTQILSGQLPPWDFTRLVVNGYNPRLGGDVFVVTQPGWLLSGPPDASHGSPWAPDTHVPLVLRGPGITPGPQYRRVTTVDIVPTISQILGIGYPTGCTGQPLREALTPR